MEPGYPWAGFYAGAHVGGGWNTTRFSDPSMMVLNPFLDTRAEGQGIVAGGQLGMNWQIGGFVVGAEGDVAWASLRGRANEGLIPADASLTIEMKTLATGTARFGYAMGRWLAYGKVGVAWADTAITTRLFAEPRTLKVQRTGLAAGAGMEVALWRSVSAKVEYNYLHFGEHAVGLALPGPLNVDHAVHLVKGGVNLRFGGDPITARY